VLAVTGDWPLNLADLEAPAAEVLERTAYDYFRSGSDDEVSLGRNRKAFERTQLLPHMLRDVSTVALETTILGSATSSPIVVAPTAFHGLAHAEAENATVRGAASAGSIFCLSSLSNTAPEDVAAAAPGATRWFQLYVFKDRGLTEELIRRVEASGYEALVLTVDAPFLGRRERDLRNSFALPDHLEIAVIGHPVDAPPGGSGLAAYFASQLDPTLTWDDLEWLVQSTTLPVAVKGVLRADDAERAVEAGAASVIVSNHGARQLDTVPAPIEVLPEIADRVDGRGELMIDGGIRRGTDVVKALSLGARGVLVGRPILWSLVLDGSAGVERTLRMLAEETRLAMALCGAASTADLGPELIRASAPS